MANGPSQTLTEMPLLHEHTLDFGLDARPRSWGKRLYGERAVALGTVEAVYELLTRRLRYDSSLYSEIRANLSSLASPTTLSLRDLNLVQAIKLIERMPLIKVVPNEQNRNSAGLVFVAHPFTATITDQQTILALREEGVAGVQVQQSVSVEMIGVSKQAWDVLARQKRLAERRLERDGVTSWDGRISINLGSFQSCCCCECHWANNFERLWWMTWVPLFSLCLFVVAVYAPVFGPPDSTDSSQDATVPAGFLLFLVVVESLWMFCLGMCICRGCRTCRHCCCTCKAMSVCEHEPEDTLPCPACHCICSWPFVWFVSLLFVDLITIFYLMHTSDLSSYVVLGAASALFLLATCPPCCVAARERCEPGTHAV